MRVSLKSIAGLAFATYLSGCSTLKNLPPEQAEPQQPQDPMVALQKKADAAKAQGKMVAITGNKKGFVAVDPITGITQDELNSYAYWSSNFTNAAFAASQMHVTRPNMRAILQHYSSTRFLTNLDENKDYTDEEIKDLVNAQTSEMIESLDAHSNYFLPKEREDFLNGMNGIRHMIGITFEAHDQGIIIRQVTEGSAAEAAGIKVDDIIHGDGARNFKGMSADDVRSYLSDPEKFSFKITRGGEALAKDIEVTKADVKLNAVRSSIIDNQTAYFKIFSFANDVHLQFKEQFEAVQAKGGDTLNGVVIDLRGNSGGSMQAVAELADYFIKDDNKLFEIARIQFGREGGGAYISEPDNELTDLPLTVLINNFSASASEIFAGVLQDYGRATIVGDGPSHGKANGQAIMHFNSPDGTTPSLKLTNMLIYLPKSGSYQQIGIQPDILVPMDTKYKAFLNQDGMIPRESDHKNALRNPQGKTAPKPSTYKCSATGDEALLSVFRMKTQDVKEADISHDSVMLCAIDNLNHTSRYSITIKNILAPQS
ncbi:MAG: S41 family peptidase [Pseudomonadota bacterium]|nr:S41 family peptidase [Pseudomonadota bacterium]MEE3322527.1 S41 family peptidase [Pseudomonadota bacterium]